ncbi:hypothetical protein [Thermoproteus uzoniensis]|nr:hypothetical protein [Thermoproteus uzoniensis]
MRLCNNTREPLRLRLRYGGPFTKTGLEGYVKYIAVAAQGFSASNVTGESAPFYLGPSECIDLDLEYEVDGKLGEELDMVKYKMIKDGVLSVGGFVFDVVVDENSPSGGGN